jgi:hypothetical protein
MSEQLQLKRFKKTQYDKSMRAKTVYRLKDLVMLNNCRREPGLSKAFTEKFNSTDYKQYVANLSTKQNPTQGPVTGPVKL